MKWSECVVKVSAKIPETKNIMSFEENSGVNIINILCTAFALVDPKSVKNTVKSLVSFYAFGI